MKTKLYALRKKSSLQDLINSPDNSFKHLFIIFQQSYTPAPQCCMCCCS